MIKELERKNRELERKITDLEHRLKAQDIKSGVAYVDNFRIKNPQKSYFYIEEGSLFFYNHSTGVTNPV